jgi:glutamate synthase domain-containing protein 3
MGMVELFPLAGDSDEAMVRQLISRHEQYTGSAVARRMLADWDKTKQAFIKVLPTEYRRVLEMQQASQPAQQASV